MDLPVNYNKTHYSQRRLVREEYIKLQRGRCCHCQGLLSCYPPKEIQNTEIDESLFPKGFFDNLIHLHHSHETDMTIGAVHARCNAVLWQYFGE